MSVELKNSLTESHNTLRKLHEDVEGNIDEILHIIKDLEKVAVTAEALRDSGLNKILNELKKSEDDKIVNATKKLIETYKTTLRAGMGNTVKTSEPVEEKKTVEKCSNSNVITPSVISPTPSNKRRATEDNLETPSSKRVASQIFKLGGLNNSTRDKAQKLFFDSLGPDSSNNDDFRTEISVCMEKAIFEKYSNSAEYNQRIRVIISNLRDPKNPDINQRLYSGELTPEEMATIPETEMASTELQKKRTEELNYIMAAKTTDLTGGSEGTDMFPCGKCKGAKTSFTQRQTRSADEPMTIFCRCMICNNRWRIYP